MHGLPQLLDSSRCFLLADEFRDWLSVVTLAPKEGVVNTFSNETETLNVSTTLMSLLRKVMTATW